MYKSCRNAQTKTRAHTQGWNKMWSDDSVCLVLARFLYLYLDRRFHRMKEHPGRLMTQKSAILMRWKSRNSPDYCFVAWFWARFQQWLELTYRWSRLIIRYWIECYVYWRNILLRCRGMRPHWASQSMDAWECYTRPEAYLAWGCEQLTEPWEGLWFDSGLAPDAPGL